MNVKLNGYIRKVCKDACDTTHHRINVKFQYAIIGDKFLYAIKTHFDSVERRISYRLANNLPKHFGLTPYNVLDIYSGVYFNCRQIDYNFSFAEWNVFGEWGTLVTGMPELHPIAEDAEDDEFFVRFHRLLDFGLQPNFKGNATHKDWKHLCDCYKRAFGRELTKIPETIMIMVNPLDMFLK